MIIIDPYLNQVLTLSITTTTSPQTFTLPMNPAGTYAATIDWGDGSSSEITSFNDADLVHNYTTASSYAIKIYGVLGGIYFNNGGDRLLVNSVDYGRVQSRANASFFGCSNLSQITGNLLSGIDNFQSAWRNCTSLTSFPLLDVSNGTNFSAAWYDCKSLVSFPANFFNGCLATNFTNAFLVTNLSQASIDGILVSINSNNTSNGTFNQSGGSAPSATGQAAITAMRSRGWTVTVTGGF